MLPAMEKLNSSVARATSVADGAVAFIEGLAQQIRDNVGDPAALGKLADDIDANSDKLAASISANTPASDAPPVAPDPAVTP